VDDGRGSHLVLVGMMGAGKTTLGKAVARRLGRPFLDSDEVIQVRTGRTVREIFEADGEAAFRELETEALADAVERPEPSVIAAAGGVVLAARNRALLRRAGRVVWLHAPPEVLAGRVRQGDHRPLLADDPLGTLRQMEIDRAALYREVADDVVEVADARKSDLVDRLVELAPR
jgi:shikimate kinase